MEYWVRFLAPFCPKSGFPLGEFPLVKRTGQKVGQTAGKEMPAFSLPKCWYFPAQTISLSPVRGTIPGNEANCDKRNIQFEAKWIQKTYLVFHKRKLVVPVGAGGRWVFQKGVCILGMHFPRKSELSPTRFRSLLKRGAQQLQKESPSQDNSFVPIRQPKRAQKPFSRTRPGRRAMPRTRPGRGAFPSVCCRGGRVSCRIIWGTWGPP